MASPSVMTQCTARMPTLIELPRMVKKGSGSSPGEAVLGATESSDRLAFNHHEEGFFVITVESSITPKTMRQFCRKVVSTRLDTQVNGHGQSGQPMVQKRYFEHPLDGAMLLDSPRSRLTAIGTTP